MRQRTARSAPCCFAANEQHRWREVGQVLLLVDPVRAEKLIKTRRRATTEAMTRRGPAAKFFLGSTELLELPEIRTEVEAQCGRQQRQTARQGIWTGRSRWYPASASSNNCDLIERRSCLPPTTTHMSACAMLLGRAVS